MKFRAGDRVKIIYNSCFDLEIGIIVKFRDYNTAGEECYYIRLESGRNFFEFKRKCQLSENNLEEGFVHSFCEVWFERIKTKLYIPTNKRFGIVKFCETHY